MRSLQNNKRYRAGKWRNSGQHVNTSFDSNGPEVRLRGTSAQIHEKYQVLARDASSSGDRVLAENLLQHAEHYYRVHCLQQSKVAEEGAYKKEKKDTQQTEARGKYAASGNNEGGRRSESRSGRSPRPRDGEERQESAMNGAASTEERKTDKRGASFSRTRVRKESEPARKSSLSGAG